MLTKMTCKNYEKSLEVINEFFDIELSANFGEETFKILQKIISLESGYIFFTNPTRLEYSYNPKTNDIHRINEPYLIEDLKLKNKKISSVCNIK